MDFSDALHSLRVLLLGEGEHDCEDAADSDDDGHLAIHDAITTLKNPFLGNIEIPAPGIEKTGKDPTEDTPGCEKPVPVPP